MESKQIYELVRWSAQVQTIELARRVLKEGKETRQGQQDRLALPEVEDGGERGELTAPEHKVSSVRGKQASKARGNS